MKRNFLEQEAGVSEPRTTNNEPMNPVKIQAALFDRYNVYLKL